MRRRREILGACGKPVARWRSNQYLCKHLVSAIDSGFLLIHPEATTRTNHFTQLAHIDLPMFSGIMKTAVTASINDSIERANARTIFQSRLHLLVSGARRFTYSGAELHQYER